MKVTRGTIVTIEYELFDGSGNEVESTEGEPVCYTHGSDEILPGLEEALEGAEVGASLRVELSPEEGYGPWHADGLFSVPRSEFPPDAEIVPGDWIEMEVHADEENEEEGVIEARITELRDGEVVLDANHPLAGQSLTFQVRIVAVEPGE